MEEIQQIKNIEIAEKQLNKILNISKKEKDNPEFPFSLRYSQIITEIKDLKEKKDILNKRINCEHKNTTGLEWVGSGSHRDYYKNICKDCGKVIDEYRD